MPLLTGYYTCPLFKQPFSSTNFYRHIKTGFESIAEERILMYWGSLEQENGAPNIPQRSYILMVTLHCFNR